MKKISSYNVLNGIVRFSDGEVRYFNKETAEMANKLIYMLSRNASNFLSESELTEKDAINIAIDLITNEP